jgi:hypothetical protein
MTVKEKATAFIDRYNQKLQQLNQKLQSCNERIEYLELETRFLQEKEIPEAQTKRVLEGDATLEKKLKKQLQKYQGELQEKQEEAVILSNAIQQYKYQAGEEASNISKLFNEDKSLQEKKAYGRMMNQKKSYIDAILKESETLKELSSVDGKLQQILVSAGRKKQVYSGIEVKTAPIPAHKEYHNGVYLQVGLDEVKRFVQGTYSKSDYDYLKPFANKKDL